MIPGGGVYESCAVALQDESLLVVGGLSEEAGTQVIQRHSSGLWDTESWPKLPERRRDHSCAPFQATTRLLVVGGYVDNSYTASTIIIDLTTKQLSKGPSMKNARAYFPMFNYGDNIFVLG